MPSGRKTGYNCFRDRSYIRKRGAVRIFDVRFGEYITNFHSSLEHAIPVEVHRRNEEMPSTVFLAMDRLSYVKGVVISHRKIVN